MLDLDKTGENGDGLEKQVVRRGEITAKYPHDIYFFPVTLHFKC